MATGDPIVGTSYGKYINLQNISGSGQSALGSESGRLGVIYLNGTTLHLGQTGSAGVEAKTYKLDVEGHDGTLGLSLGGTLVTATAAELNIMDGVTATTAELNTMSGITATTEELNIMDGVTATAAELNTMDGITAATAELNKLDGCTATTDQLNFVAGATAGTAAANKALVLDASRNITNVNSLTLTGDLTVQGTTTTVDVEVIQSANGVIFEGATADDFETTLKAVDPTADRTVQIADSAGYLVPFAAAEAAGTQITATAAELNLLDGSTANTVVNSKAVVYGSAGEIAATSLAVAGNISGSGKGYFEKDVEIADNLKVSGSGTFVGTLSSSLGDFADISLGGTAISATAAELNIMDGVTATTAELNILDGVTSTAAELNILDGVTATAAELNILDGVTATATELNLLDGVTSTTAELNILDGVTSTATELNLLDGSTANTVVNSKAVVYGSSGQVAATSLTVSANTSGSTAQFAKLTASAGYFAELYVSGSTLHLGDTSISAAEIAPLDSVDAGTVTASKAVVVDSNKDITGFQNITLTGELDAGSLDISGNADIDGTLETDALSINDTLVTATAAELNILDGVTATAAELNILDGVTSTATELNLLDGSTANSVVNSKAVVYGSAGEIAASSLAVAGNISGSGKGYFEKDVEIADNLKVSGSGTFVGTLSSSLGDFADISLGGTAISATAAELNIMDGITATTAELNIMDGVTATTAELNIMDGVTATATELNIMDGNTAASSTTLASEDRVVVNDNGTMKQVAMSDVVTFMEGASGIDAVNGDLTIGGSLTVNGSTVTVDATNMTVEDSLIKLNKGDTNSPARDQGFIFSRGNGSSADQDNYAMLWDESADEFVFAAVGTEDATTSGNVTLSSYADLRANTINMATLEIDSTAVTSTAAELNILDGVTATATELNLLDGVTSTTAELNILDGVTSTATELNLLDGSTANSVVNSKAVIYGSSGQIAATSLAVAGNISGSGKGYFEKDVEIADNLKVSGSGTFNGRVLVDDTTQATSTTDGSLQTDGGLSVAKNAVIGNDLYVGGDAADDPFVYFQGASGSPGNFKWSASNDRFQFNDDLLFTAPDGSTASEAAQFRGAGQKVYSSAADTLDIVGPTTNIQGTTAINLQTDALSIGEGGAADVVMTFNTDGNDGVITWKDASSEDYFQFSDDVMIPGGENLYFGNTSHSISYLTSLGPNRLALDAEKTYFSATTGDPNVCLQSTAVNDRGAKLTFLSAEGADAPSADDYLGHINFKEDTSDGYEYAEMSAQVETQGASADGKLHFNVAIGNGAQSDGLTNVVTLSKTGLLMPNNSTYGVAKAHSFVTYSDETLKNNIAPIDSGLDKVMALQGVTYDWKSDGTADIGFIAQDVEKVIPQAVYGNEEGDYGLDYGSLTSVLVEAVKEQQAQIEELKAELRNKADK